MLRIVFMGTPEFSVPALSEIVAAGHDVAAVYAQPPRPAGRGMSEKRSPVHVFAEAAGTADADAGQPEKSRRRRRRFTAHDAPM